METNETATNAES